MSLYRTNPDIDEYLGLGDWGSECIAAIRNRPAGYVFAGSQLRYTAEVTDLNQSGFAARPMTDVEGSVAAAGFYNVSALANAGALSMGDYNVTIFVNAPVDFYSSNDISGILYGALVANGFQVQRDSLSIMSRPNDDQLCKQMQLAGVPIAAAPGSPLPVDDLGVWEKLKHALGISGVSLGVGAAVIGVVVLFAMGKR